MSSHVFISHSHDDKGTADLILHALEKRGVKCWIAPRDVTPGGSYAESILNAIETASCFVLIYSNNSNLSPHVIREVERALNFGVNIIPVRFDQSTPSKSLDYLLATVHWLSISEPVAGEIARAAEQIAAAVARAQPKSSQSALSSPPPVPAVSKKPRSSKMAVAIGAGALSILVVALLLVTVSKRSRPASEVSNQQPSSQQQSSQLQSGLVVGSLTVVGPKHQAEPSAAPVLEESVDEMTQQNVTDFVKGFVHDLSSNDVARRVAYFANPCRYFSNANASVDDVRQDIEQETAQWKQRTNMLSPIKVGKVNDQLRVTFSVIYSYQGAKEHTSGIRDFKLALKPHGTGYLIAAISKADLR
jgi:hypothetical protein